MDPRIEEVKQRYETTLKRLPNVVGVAVGLKTTGGTLTNREAIVVMVRKKLPENMMAAAELVPALIEGLLTDVVEIGEVRAMQTAEASVEAHRRSYEPVVGGISCAPPYPLLGTVGLPHVFDKQGREGLLTNRHVALPNWLDPQLLKKGAPVHQPGRGDGGIFQGRVVATAEDLLPLRPGQDNEADAEFAVYVAGEGGTPEILGIGPYTGVQDPEPGQSVKKSGRTTGVTDGLVVATDASLPVDYPGLGRVNFVGQVLLTPMLKPGDSGSVIMAGDKVVALGFAASDTVAVATPINTVLDRLGLTLTAPGGPPGGSGQPVQAGQALAPLGDALEAVWGFDAVAQRFLLYDPRQREISDLDQLEAGKGYWIRMTRAAELRFGPRQLVLVAGWNLVGWI